MLRHRRFVSALAIGALATASVLTGTSHAARRVVFVANGGPPLVRPSTLYASLANGPYGKDLIWQDWGEGRAKAEGTVYYDTCEPDCSAGYHSTLGQVLLTGVHRCFGQLRYSQLRIVYFPAPQHDLRASYDCRGVATHVHIGRP